MGLLCALGGWSFYQVIFAVKNGRVRRFRQPIFRLADSGYCMRAAQPGWYRYHIVVYTLQGVVAFVLPVYMLCRMLF
jgi:hypothetical protein